jgi:ABC-type multidrug transport system ATPase subunit
MRVQLQRVSKWLGRSQALVDISMDVAPGQIVAVLGPNGAGKTTLLRCLAGILVPNRGEIRYDGELFRRDRLDLRRRFGFLESAPQLFPTMSLIRHIGMVLQLYGADPEEAEERVVEMLGEFDLLVQARSQIATLSRGQSYKGAPVGLLAVDPEVWLLDEPFASGMDPHGITALKRHARDALHRGRTILYTTQILDLAESFSDRVCILHEGRIHVYEPTASIRHRAGGSLEELFERLREPEEWQ